VPPPSLRLYGWHLFLVVRESKLSGQVFFEGQLREVEEIARAFRSRDCFVSILSIFRLLVRPTLPLFGSGALFLLLPSSSPPIPSCSVCVCICVCVYAHVRACVKRGCMGAGWQEEERGGDYPPGEWAKFLEARKRKQSRSMRRWNREMRLLKDEKKAAREAREKRRNACDVPS
jgi:hypothetical protein